MSEWFSAFGRSMGPFGQLLLMLTFLTSVFGVVFGFVGALKRQRRLTEAALYSVYLFCGLLTTATLLLVYSLYTHDFSIIYVQGHSNATQPTLYRITALWGGQRGSLLFWAFILSAYGAASFAAIKDRMRPILPHAITIFMGIGLFFSALLLIKVNPFEMQMFGDPPLDGQGLNPLLQTPLMAIHPPSLYLGYIGFAIPFAFAMGALWAGKLDSDWIRATRKATLISFTFLSVGNILGSWWAYEEIGWGGFWAWDPVETAAFFPWLTGTAFLHSVMIQERRGMFKVWNVFLIAITFFLTILGTMLTRSGLVESVHSFAKSEIGTWFGIFLGIITLVSIGLIILRWKDLRQQKDSQFHVLSREFSFLVQNVILTVMAITLVVFVLTPMFTKEIWPVFVETFTGEKIVGAEASMGPQFYNIYMAPLGLILLFLMGVGPLIAWRKATSKNLFDAFWIPVLFGILGGIVFFLLGIRDLFPLSIFILSSFVTATVIKEFVQGTRIRMKHRKENFFTALMTLVLKGKRRYGGYIVHLGIVCCFLGFAGAYYQGQRDLSNIQMQPRDLKASYDVEPYDFDRDWKDSFVYGEYSFHYYDLRIVETDNGEEYRTYLAVKRNGEEFGHLAPGRNWYRTAPDQPSTEVDVHWGFLSDLYITTGGFDLQTGEAVFTVTINPLVFWLWLGMFLMLGGCGICMAPELRFVRVKTFAVTTGMFVGLALFLLAPTAMAQGEHDHDDHEGHNHGPVEATPGAGPAVSNFPDAVNEAANQLSCFCGCPHTLAQCTRSECSPGTTAKEEMTKLHQEQGYDSEALVDWYVTKFTEQSGKSSLRLVTPDNGIGKDLTMLTWIIGLGGAFILAIVGFFLRRRTQKLALSGVDTTNDFSVEEEKMLQEELERLE